MQSIVTAFTQAALARAPQEMLNAQMQLAWATVAAVLWAVCAYMVLCAVLDACVRMLGVCVRGLRR